METLLSEGLYRLEKIDDRFYCINEANSNNIYILKGQDKTLLFDTAYGFCDFRKYIAKINRKPLVVVCSHGHYDHTLGNYLFDEVYLHKEDEILWRKADNPELKENAIAIREKKIPDMRQMMSVDAYLKTSGQNTKCRYIKEGDVFDLGRLHCEVIEMPGHTKGSIALYVPERQILLSGDSISNHFVWYAGKREDVASYKTYVNSLKKILNYDKPIKEIYSGHGTYPLEIGIVERMIECMYHCAENTNEEDLPVISSPDGTGRQFTYKDTSIVYSDELMEEFRRELNEND